ncbi:hypothetical protein [Mycobacterium sp. 48b]|uniref:hypothetical protein n=1 Tax=Mycobacterium sp. 48b TaxID=3400426 RepID=UPI003AAF9D79
MAKCGVDGGNPVVSVSIVRDECRDPAYRLLPRLVLVATSVAEAMTAAGGWLFDQTMAGWDALVVARDLANAPSLQILGARGIGLDEALVERSQGAWPQILAVSAAMYQQDPVVRSGVDQALQRRSMTVSLWGPRCPDHLKTTLTVCHREYSHAAGVFKHYALAASGISPSGMLGRERFHTADTAVPVRRSGSIRSVTAHSDTSGIFDGFDDAGEI